jgi:hypothetical protein
MVLVLISNRSIYQGAENDGDGLFTAKTGAPFATAMVLLLRQTVEHSWKTCGY